MTQAEFLQTFASFSVKERLAIAKKIQLNVADHLFKELDAELPDIDMSMEEIQDEINAYRREKREKAEGRP